MSTTAAYITGAVTSQDGTAIGYRQVGHGEGVLLIHGGMQAAQSFMQLATALSSDYTVTVMDRRGRGQSGPFGANYSLARDVQDVAAVLHQTGAQNIFGLSSGAIIALQSALALPNIRKLAVYEPPLSVNHSTDTTWLPRFDREIAQGDLAAAMVTVMKGTGDTSAFSKLPRFLTVPLLRLAVRAQSGEVQGDDVPLAALIPTMHYDLQVVNETADTLPTFAAVKADVLLLGGSNSALFLKSTLDRLSRVLPHVRRVEFKGFDHVAAANDGHPLQVAQVLSQFFGQAPNAD